MNKKIIYLIIGLIIILVAGILSWRFWPKEEVEISEYKLYTGPVYRNEKYGFQLVMPSSWIKYAIKEGKEGQITKTSLALPLQDGEEFFDIWSLHIMPISDWESQKRECEDPSVNYPCFYPTEITRNEKYVFGSGQYFIAGGWDPCADEDTKSKEPYFCRVYSDMFLEKGYDIVQSFSFIKK